MKSSKIIFPIAFAAISSLSFGQIVFHDDGLTTTSITGYVNGHDVYLAPVNADINGGPQFVAYCVDLQNEAQQGWSWNVTPVAATSGLPNGAQIAKLYNAFAGTASSSTSGQVSLQLAIWADLVGGGLINSGGGALSVSVDQAGYGSLITQANTWLSDTSALNAASSSATWIKANSHPNNDYQDFLTGGANVAATPEPASLLALGAGVGLLVRKRVKK